LVTGILNTLLRDTAPAMAQAPPGNLENVRRAHEHFARTGEPLWEINDPAVEVFDHDIPDARNPYRGQEGVAQWLSDFSESWDSFGMELQELVEAGDRIVSLFRIRAVGAGSGVSVERGDAMVWKFRDGRLVRLDYFNDQRQALDSLDV
jgi:ketosteroid isomerase-like protein